MVHPVNKRENVSVRFVKGEGFAVFMKSKRETEWRGTRDEAQADEAMILKQFRPCLRCTHEFRSAGIQNRLCDSCRHFSTGIL